MYRFILIISIILTSWFSVGCQNLARPQLLPQTRIGDPIGNARELDYLRQRAQRFDPSPESGLGPSIENLRPSGFEKAPPEASRARYFDRDQLGL